MELFLNFGNLLNSNWEPISTHPILFLLYGVLVAALAWNVRGFVIKDKVDAKLIDERKSLDEELHRQQYINCQLKQVNKKLTEQYRILTEQHQILQSNNEELGQRVQELNIERIKSNRKIEVLMESMAKLAAEKASIEVQITKPTEPVGVPRIEHEKEQQVLPVGLDRCTQGIYQKIQQEIYQKLMEETERARRRP